MENRKLTSKHFDEGGSVRNTLRYQHHFEHGDLERASAVMGDAIRHVEHTTRTTGMRAEHLDTALRFLNENHKEWKSMPEHQKRHIETALKKHFNITEPEAETA